MVGGGFSGPFTPRASAVSFEDSIYALHEFQKKSESVMAMPQAKIDFVGRRLDQLKSEIKNASNEAS